MMSTMISAKNLLLLRRLAYAPTTTTETLLHRTISIARCSPPTATNGNGRHRDLGSGRTFHLNRNTATGPTATATLVHLHAASFSSPSAADAADGQAPGEDPLTTEIDDDAKEVSGGMEGNITSEDVNVDICKDPPPTSISSGDDYTSSILNEDIPPPLELLPEDTTNTDTTTAAATAATNSIIDYKFQGIAPENVIRTGKIISIDYKRMSGVILQDEPFRSIGPLKKDIVGFTFKHIYTKFQIDDKIKMEPYIDKRRRVQFQAWPSLKREGQLNGFNIRYDDEETEIEEGGSGGSAGRGGGGSDIPLLHWTGAFTLIQSAKAKLGRNVYDLLSKASMKEDKALAKKVENEMAACNKRIVWARKSVSNPTKATRECKARLGEEMYDMLSNIDKVDNVQRRADEAYFRCRDSLSTLGLSVEPNNNQNEEQKHVELLEEDNTAIE